jgi:hypothetical protein
MIVQDKVTGPNCVARPRCVLQDVSTCVPSGWMRRLMRKLQFRLDLPVLSPCLELVYKYSAQDLSQKQLVQGATTSGAGNTPCPSGSSGSLARPRSRRYRHVSSYSHVRARETHRSCLYGLRRFRIHACSSTTTASAPRVAPVALSTTHARGSRSSDVRPPPLTPATVTSEMSCSGCSRSVSSSSLGETCMPEIYARGSATDNRSNAGSAHLECVLSRKVSVSSYA